MDLKQRVYFTSFATAAGFTAGFLLTASVALPVLWYYPVARHWEWVDRPHGLAMDWYGRNLVAIVIAGVTGVLTWLRTKQLRPPRTEMGYQLIAIWTTTMVAFAAGLYVYQLAPRHARPEPLPPSYVPR